MDRFSPSDAALEGFQVLKGHWRVVIGWAAFNIIALVLLGGAGAVLGFGADAAASAGAIRFNPLLGALVAMLAEAFITSVIATGLFRLMLRPQERGLLHLRMGVDELRVLAVWILLSIASFLLLGVCAALVMAGRSISPAAALGAWLFVVVVGIWLGLRFSLSAVATFAERRFAFRRAWRLTRGHSWPLLGMAVLSGTLIVLIGFVVFLVAFVAMGVSVGFGDLMDALISADGREAHPGLYLAQFLVQLALFPAFAVLMLAPWVVAYRAFTGDETAA